MSFFSDVYFIGGTDTPLNRTFQNSLLEVKDEIIEDKDELLELENGFILVSMAKAIKLINMTWNMPQKEDSKDDDDHLHMLMLLLFVVNMIIIIFL